MNRMRVASIIAHTAGVALGLVGAAQAAPRPSALVPRGEEEAMTDQPVVGGAATFKPGAGLQVRSADGRFSLRVSLWSQLRATTHHNQIPASGAANPSTALEITRARLIVAGEVFSKDIHYLAHLMFAPKDLGFKDGTATRAPIFLWFTSYTRLKNANLQAGFFFVPYSRQRLTLATSWQMLENSSASYEFTLAQDIGVQVSSPDLGGLGLLRYSVGVFSGEGYDWARSADPGLNYAARLEFLPLGMFQDYAEADFERRRVPRLALALAYAFSDRDHQTRAVAGAAFADGGTMSAHNATADLVFKWSGMSILADVYLRDGWRQPGRLTQMDGSPVPVQAARNGVGWTAQMGVLIPRTRFEIVGRRSGVRPLKTGPTSLTSLDEAGAGLNYYFFRHALKLQLDYIHTWGPGRPTGRSDQARLQLQAVF